MNRGADKYREINKEMRTGTKEAKERWIEEQCSEIEDSLNKNNSKRTFQVIKEKKGRINTIQDESGKMPHGRKGDYQPMDRVLH